MKIEYILNGKVVKIEPKYEEYFLKNNPTAIKSTVPGKSKEAGQPQTNQQTNTESNLEDGSLESLAAKIKQSEKKILDNQYEERLGSINEQLKSIDGDENPEKYNNLVNNYNSILKEYEVEYEILNNNIKGYNNIYNKDNPRISNNPIGYSLVDSRFQNIELSDELPDYDMEFKDIDKMSKRARDKKAEFISSTPDQILTYNTAKEWFDINASYGSDVRKKVVEDGTHGYNPKTKELFELTESERNMKQATHNDIVKDYKKRYEDGMLGKDEYAEALENMELISPGFDEYLEDVPLFYRLQTKFMMNTGVGRLIMNASMGYAGVASNITTGLISAVESERILEGAKQGKTIEEMVEDRDISPVHLIQKDFNKISNQFATKHFDEQGGVMTPKDLIQTGRIGDAATLLAEQSIAQIPSLAISVGGGLAFGPAGAAIGAGILGGSVYGQEMVADLERLYIDKGIIITDKEASLLRKGSFMKAGAEWAGEFAGAMLFRAGGGLLGGGAAKKTVKAFTDSYTKRFIAGYIGGSLSEGLSESFTSVMQDATDKHIYGDEVGFKDFWRNGVNSFLIGSVLGGGLSSTMEVVNKPTKQQAQMAIASMKWKTKKSKIQNDIIETELKLKNAKGQEKNYFENKLKGLNKQNTLHDQQLETAFGSMTNKELINYAKKQDALSKELGLLNTKMSVKDKKDVEKRIDQILEEQNSLTDGFVDVSTEKAIGEFLQNLAEIKKQAATLGFGSDLKIKYLNNEKQIEAAKKELEEKNIKYSGEEGLFLSNDGVIYVNTVAAAAVGQTNVLGHELLHYMMSKNFKVDNASMKKMVDALKDFLSTTERGKAIIDRIDKRLIQNGYLSRDGKFQPGALEEYFQMLSDIIKKNKMPLPDASPKTLSKAFKDMFTGLGLGSVELNTGQQIFDFIKTYTEHVNRKGLFGQITKRRVLKTKLESKLGEKADPKETQETQDKRSKTEAENIINEIGSEYGWDNVSWKTVGHVFAVKTIEEESLLDRLIAAKLKVPMSPARTKEFVKKVLAELTPHIKNFNPEINDSLFGWINSQISNKAGNVYNREYKVTQRTQDIDARTSEGALVFQVEADTSLEQDLIDQIGLDDKQQDMYSELRRRLNLGKEMMDKVRRAVIKTFGTKLPDVNTKKFKDELQKRFRTELKKTIQDLIGSRNNYNEFLKNNFEAVYNALPVETLVQMERSVKPEQRIFTKSKRVTKPVEVDKLISEGLLPKDTNRLSGPQLHIKNPYPGQAKVMAFFRGTNMLQELGYEVGASTLGTRKDKLAMEIGVELAFDATAETVQMPDVQEKRRGILQLQGQEQAVNELAVIAKQINRDPRVKFSASSAGSKVFKDGVDLVNAISAQGDLTGIAKLNSKGNYVGINEYTDIPSSTINFVIKNFYENNKISLHPGDILKKLSKLVPAGDTRTKGFEQYVIDRFGKIEGVDLVFEYQSEQGVDIPDVYAKFHGQDFHIEVKMFDAQVGSLSINDVNLKTGEIIIDKIDNLSQENQNKIKEIAKKIVPVLKDVQSRAKEMSSMSKEDIISLIGQANKKLPRNQQIKIPKSITKQDINYLKNWNSPKSFMPNWAHGVLKAEGYWSRLTQRATFTQTLIENFYLNKAVPTNYIYILGKGLFSIGGDVLNLGVPRLEGTFSVPIRQVKSSQKQTVKKVTTKTGYVNINLRAIPVVDKITSKSDIDILDKSGVDALSKTGKHLESVKRSKSIVTYNSAIANQIKYSKSGKKTGMSTFDFDDTMAYTKSGVRVTIPNNDGKPKPGKKVIFLAGGAGSGKGNIIKKLGLEGMGFKIVNQDISLEWLKKNHGLPENMNELTKEQRSLLGKLGHQARGIARRKMMKFQGNGNGVVVDGTGGSAKQMQKLVEEFEAKGYDVSMVFVETSLDVALERNRARKERSLLDVIVRRNHESVQNNKSTFKDMFGKRFMEVNTDNLTMDSPMPTELIEQMNDFVFSYEKRRLDAAEFAEQGSVILEQGGEFDFSEFNDVVEGMPGPLLDKAKQRAEKFGTKDMYILTARPQASAKAIQEFLKSQGLNIPIENITGLANSTGNAKAEWFLEKFAEGYNDMYFVDDALANVEAVKKVLDQLDVKSDVVQAKVKFSKTAGKEFNKIIEESQGTDADRIISQAEAKRLGRNKGWWRIFVPPSAEDFKGLLYRFLGKGKQGDKHMAWFKDNLLDPFAKGIRSWNIYKQNMVNEYKQLKKDFKDVTKSLNDKVPGTTFTVDAAIRVYLWKKAGFEIPGLDTATETKLNDYVLNNIEVKSFADTLSEITQTKDGYVKPSNNWSIQTIATDLNNVVNKVGRKQFLAEYLANVEAIFTTENMNKIEALYGTGFKEALENILYRMENGRNRNRIYDRNSNRLLNWINGSIGAIMFFNMRSAILQTISTVNFINWSDNNIFKASAAFANQKQFWSDFAMLFNSPQLKQRRAGIQIDVSASELSRAFSDGRGTPQSVINWLLEKGFTPTQIADSFAIAFGGASFIRNRIKTYIKQGMTEAQAKDKAMLDFQEIAEETQQSSREDLISQQQASVLGRLILAFQNVTMQYTRLMKKSLSDIVNGRGDMKTNISKVIYYGAVQNIIFASLQSALAFMMWGDEEDEEVIDDKAKRTLNSAFDSLLRGTGMYGAAVAAIKNTILRWQVEKEKGYGRRDDGRIILEALNFSPPIGSKLRKIYSAIKTESYNMDEISDEIGFRIENPKLYALASIIEAATNIPLQRLVRKANNLEEAITSQHETWQRIALALGWDMWSLGIKDEELEQAKQDVKKNINDRRIEDRRKKKEDEEKDMQKRGFKKIRCSGVRSNGERCKIMSDYTKDKKFLCTHHMEFKDGMDRDGDGLKEYRCTAVKSNGKRCKNKTENKNKKCYAHQ